MNLVMQTSRCEQRLSHYKRSLDFLTAALNVSERSHTVNAGVVKAYEMCFELGWKTLKDFLEFKGFSNLLGSRDVVNEGFTQGLIKHGHT